MTDLEQENERLRERIVTLEAALAEARFKSQADWQAGYQASREEMKPQLKEQFEAGKRVALAGEAERRKALIQDWRDQEPSRFRTPDCAHRHSWDCADELEALAAEEGK